MEKCFDCGSTVPGHHTLACELAAPQDAKDLPAIPGTQYWADAERGKALPPAK